MDTKTLVKALKVAVREVIKEELTEILRDGLQSTIVEMADLKSVAKSVKTDSDKVIRVEPRMVSESGRKSKVQFNDNKWASVLNETDSLLEQEPLAMNSFRDLMNEGIEEIKMNSQNAVNFGTMRQNMREAMGVAPTAPKIMEDPETGKTFEVPQEVQQAMTRDYSALMKAINKKKGM
jgi:Ribonuclease G/E